MNDHEMNIKVSGRTVYDAVKNYIQNSPELQKEINSAVAALASNGTIERQIERQVKEALTGTYLAQSVERAIKTHIQSMLTVKIEGQVQSSIKKALENAVFLVPKKED